MILAAQTFWLPKMGNSPDDYEDAFATNERGLRFALSDGATESSFSASWAQDLVAQFVKEATVIPVQELDWQAWLEPIQAKWRARIKWHELPWFATDKAREGAFSTLLGLEFQQSPEEAADAGSLHWRAVAAGDSCLFQLRAGKLLTAFPLSNSQQFNNRPVLLASNPESNRKFAETIRSTPPSRACTGDQFFLATDALADWFLRQHEAGKQPAVELARLTSQEHFAEWTVRQRKDGQMRNDDVTLVTVHCLPPLPLTVGSVGQPIPSP